MAWCWKDNFRENDVSILGYQEPMAWERCRNVYGSKNGIWCKDTAKCDWAFLKTSIEKVCDIILKLDYTFKWKFKYLILGQWEIYRFCFYILLPRQNEHGRKREREREAKPIKREGEKKEKRHFWYRSLSTVLPNRAHVEKFPLHHDREARNEPMSSKYRMSTLRTRGSKHSKNNQNIGRILHRNTACYELSSKANKMEVKPHIEKKIKIKTVSRLSEYLSHILNYWVHFAIVFVDIVVLFCIVIFLVSICR